MAEWKHAGLETLRKVVQVEFGAKFVCWWKCEIGLCELGIGLVQHHFFHHFLHHCFNIKKEKKSMCKLLDHTMQLLDARK